MSDEAVVETSEPVAAEPVAAAPVEAAAPTSWLDGLDEEHRSNPLINKWETINDMAKSYVNQSSFIGADKVARPSNNWNDDQYNEFYNAIGRPESADLYEIAANGNEELVNNLRQVAWEAGLQPRQLSKLVDWMQTSSSEFDGNREANAVAIEEGYMNELQQEFGHALEKNVERARKAATMLLGSDEIFSNVELSDGTLLGNHPDIVRMFIKIGGMIREDNMVGEPTETVMTPAEAKRLINDHMKPGTPYTDANLPGHDEAVEEVKRLWGYAV